MSTLPRLPYSSESATVRSLASLLLIAGAAACVPVREPAPRTYPIPERLPADAGGSLGNPARPASPDLLGNVEYDLPVEANTWVEAEVEFLLTERRETVERWLMRGDYYRDFVHQIFRDYGIPTDLYHLGLIESGFIPGARSTAGAVGVWQFMSATSGDVGLRIDPWVDERMDPVRSTRAAARHLRSLYRVHGDWALAAAAYNAGSGRISRGLERFSATNFWDLALRGDLVEETRHYVPRLYAMTIIGRNRERFGFQPRPAIQPFAFDSIHVEYALPLSEVARLGDVRHDVLSELNPHLVRGTTPPGGYWVWVPAGTGVRIQRAYLAANIRGDYGAGSYTVRRGDSLGAIAQASGASAATIREMNPDIDFDRLQAGARIRLPSEAAERLADGGAGAPAGGGTTAAASGPGGSATAAYTVRWGDTLGDLASRSGVSSARIRELNPDVDFDRLITGSRIRLPESGAARLGGVADARAAEQAPAGEAAGDPMAMYTVRWGDTLGHIAQRGGVSASHLRELNPEVDFDRLISGSRIRVPAAAAPRLSTVALGTGASANDVVTESPPETVATYTVRWGDTLGHIAQRSGVSAARIRELNPDVDFDRLITGARIRIPANASQDVANAGPREGDAVAARGSASSTPALATAARTASSSSGRSYVVRTGDTLWGIAQEHDVTIDAIQQANGMTGGVIRPGQRLTIPGGEAPVAMTEHVVESGETLWGIARRYGSTIEAIEAANGLADRPIVPGQKLTIPGVSR